MILISLIQSILIALGAFVAFGLITATWPIHVFGILLAVTAVTGISLDFLTEGTIRFFNRD